MQYDILMTGCCCYTQHSHGHWGKRGFRTGLECECQIHPIHDGVHALKPREAKNNWGQGMELSDEEIKCLILVLVREVRVGSFSCCLSQYWLSHLRVSTLSCSSVWGHSKLSKELVLDSFSKTTIEFTVKCNIVLPSIGHARRIQSGIC